MMKLKVNTKVPVLMYCLLLIRIVYANAHVYVSGFTLSELKPSCSLLASIPQHGLRANIIYCGYIPGMIPIPLDHGLTPRSEA